MLDPFPVVGTRLAAPDDVAKPHVVVLDETFIERSGATDLAQLINLLPQTYGGSASEFGTVPNGAPSYGTATSLFNFTTGSAVPLRQTGVSSVGLSGLGAGGTLVLVDGRRLPLATQEDTASSTGAGFYDLSSIPLGMVERVEVLANGASAVHGSDAVGGVINVILRRHYTGSELTSGIRGTFDGGAFERHATLSTGMTRDRLSLFFSATARSQNALKAAQRTFSANQDLTARGGRDHRLVVGSPAVLSASVGGFDGITDSDGTPARYVLVPTNQNGDGLTPHDFTGAGGFTGAGLRYYDSAATKDLIGSSEQLGLRGSATFTVNPHLQAFAQLSWSDHSSETTNEPPAISGGGFGGAQSLIPATLSRNPFGQDVFFTGVVVEAPPRTQTVGVQLTTLTTGLRGIADDRWQWDVAATYSREHFDSRTLELDEDAFVTALADGSYNAFGDPLTHGPLNTHLNEVLMKTSRIVGVSQVAGLDASLRGPVFPLPAGDILFAAGAETARAQRERASTDPVIGQPAEIASTRTSSAAFAEIYLPWVSEDNALPFIRHLSARIAARHERTDAFSETSPSLGLHWQPGPDITVFAHYAEGFRAPALTELEDIVSSSTLTISDPQKGGTRYAVTRLRGGNTHVSAETSQTYQFGLTLNPRTVSGLQLHFHTDEVYYRNKLNVLPEQVLVNHESRFPDRIIRDASGRITTIDATTINFGEIYTRNLDLGLSYDFTSDRLGRITLQADAVRQLDYRIADRPDRPGDETPDGSDTVSPPSWRGLARLLWNRGSWDITVLASYLADYESNGSGPFLDQSTTTPSITTVDLRIGYTFRQGLWHGRARDARLQLGIGNVADRQPPFANTPYGYNQSLHSPLGRTYDVTLRLPF